MPKGYKHGLRYTRAYSAWLNMRQRCLNPERPDYPYYGGRGITICNRWSSIVNFVEDMGQPPEGGTLERIDTNGNYEPENCEWVSRLAQSRNTRLSKWWHVNGVKYESIAQAAEANGVAVSTIQKWCYGTSSVVKGKCYTYPPREGCWTEPKYD